MEFCIFSDTNVIVIFQNRYRAMKHSWKAFTISGYYYYPFYLCKDSGNYLKTVKTKDVFFPFFSSYLFIFKLPLPIVLEGKICKLHFNINIHNNALWDGKDYI